MRPDLNDGQGPEGFHKERYSSRRIFFLLLVCCAGFIYVIWLRSGGTAAVCVFHMLTGFKCPGCGVTRMFLALLQMDFWSAYDANPFLFITLPYLVILLAYSAFKWVRYERPGKKTEAFAALYCIGLVLFGIFRNLV